MSTGFEGMDKDRLREVQSKGGKSGKKHQFTDEERRRGAKNAQSHPNVKKAKLTPEKSQELLRKRWNKPPLEKEETDND